MQSLLILGRQPALAIAEIESLYGPDKLKLVGKHAAIVDIDPCLLAFDRLGGSIKFCKLLTHLDTTNWGKIEEFLIKASPEQSKSMPEGKMQLGLSLYGFTINPKSIMASGLKLKKAIQETGRSVRLIPNKVAELNSAQVIYNKLTSPNGWELVCVKGESQTYIAQTVKVQDIESYTDRDRERPMRDARVGMLPPKLAQIIINISVGLLPIESMQSICDVPSEEQIPIIHFGQTILDPFCGTGVILQEALMMGYDSYGSDRDPRIIEYSEKNLLWLNNQSKNSKLLGKDGQNYKLEIGDATVHKWKHFDFVASESYLGNPLTYLPNNEKLMKIIGDCNLIITKFLENMYRQTSPGTRFCIAIPAWQISQNKFKHLPLIDQISDLGYNLISFKHAKSEDLIYYRTGQIVARQLLAITRN